MSTQMLSGCMLGMLSSILHFGNFVCAVHCSASIDWMALVNKCLIPLQSTIVYVFIVYKHLSMAVC